MVGLNFLNKILHLILAVYIMYLKWVSLIFVRIRFLQTSWNRLARMCCSIMWIQVVASMKLFVTWLNYYYISIRFSLTTSHFIPNTICRLVLYSYVSDLFCSAHCLRSNQLKIGPPLLVCLTVLLSLIQLQRILLNCSLRNFFCLSSDSWFICYSVTSG